MSARFQTLLDAADARSAPIHFWHSRESIDTWPAKKLLGAARACAERFRCAGVNPGDRVALMLPTSPELIAAILGAWGCGAAMVILPHSLGAQSSKLSHDNLSALLALLAPRLLIHEIAEGTADAAWLGSLVPECLGRTKITHLPPSSAPFPIHPTGPDLAVIQLTSGSTGLPKGVMLTHAQVLANCAAVQNRAQISNSDHMVSWLPLNHDMGLGALTVSIWTNASVTLIPSERFVRSPTTWLEAISDQRGTISGSPAFAYALLAKYGVRLRQLNIDLSSWRYTWIGAEPVFEKHLEAFAGTMRIFGLRNDVLKPAYGLAEAVVAVSFGMPGRPYRTIHVDADQFRTTGKISIHGANCENVIAFVSNGPVLDNVSVRIVDEQGVTVADAQEGYVWIHGKTLTSGYLNGVDADLFKPDGWFDTGDLGFMWDEELFISGRAKDLIIRGGVNTSPQQIEWAVEEFMALRAGQVAAFSVIYHGRSTEEVVVLIGRHIDRTKEIEIRSSIARVVAEKIGMQVDRIVFTASGRLPKTTSGKLQRGLAKQMFLDGHFLEKEMEQ